MPSGFGSSSSWKTLGSLIQTYYKYPPFPFLDQVDGTISTNKAYVIKSSISHTITVTAKSRLIISGCITGNIDCAGCSSGGKAEVDLLIDGVQVVPDKWGIIDLIVFPGSGGGTATISNFF